MDIIVTGRSAYLKIKRCTPYGAPYSVDLISLTDTKIHIHSRRDSNLRYRRGLPPAHPEGRRRQGGGGLPPEVENDIKATNTLAVFRR